MTLASSGTLTLNDIQGEFGGSNPIGLNEYYRGGSLVPNHSNTSSIPTSGTIDVQDFHGTSSASPTAQAFENFSPIILLKNPDKIAAVKGKNKITYSISTF